MHRLLPLLGLLPGLIWLAYWLVRRRFRPGSFRNFVRVFLWGCASTVPTLLLEHFAGANVRQEMLLNAATASFLLIGPIEEAFKFGAVWVAIYRRPDFREPFDGIVYACTAALGFASIENILYIMEFGAGPGSLLSRSLFATPAHLLFSAMWGYSMGIARFRRTGELSTMLKGFALAAGLHGVYNFAVAANPKYAMVSLLPLIAFMSWLLWKNLEKTKLDHPFVTINSGPLVSCPFCGALTAENEKCSRCNWDVFTEHDAPKYCSRCRALIKPDTFKCRRCGLLFDEAQ
jgi:protease PrsW